MVTPLRTSNSDPLLNSGPSGSLLKHLLDEINGTATRAVSHNRNLTYDTPHLESNFSKRASSVWVGGSSVAQDARHRLRAADEARLCREHFECVDGTPQCPTPTFFSHTSPLDTQPPSPDGDCYENDATELIISASSPGSMVTNSARHTVGGLRLMTSSFDPYPYASNSDITRRNSPLIFSDVDPNDIYWSSSPTEAPTSAGTDASTSMTSAAMEHGATSSDSGSVSPGKREFSPSTSPKRMSKRTRTMPLLDIESTAMSHSDITPLRSYGVISGDDRTLIRTSTFTERASEPSIYVARHSISRPSSFRPEFADPQGRPRPSTSVQLSARAASFSSCSDKKSPVSTETPPWATPMHLVDTGYKSIYKNVHGNEWLNSPLCLYCFRQNGCFSRVKTHGYEVCGREEALQSHFWDPNFDTWEDA